jgi:hypothetical protein
VRDGRSSAAVGFAKLGIVEILEMRGGREVVVQQVLDSQLGVGCTREFDVGGIERQVGEG